MFRFHKKHLMLIILAQLSVEIFYFIIYYYSFVCIAPRRLTFVLNPKIHPLDFELFYTSATYVDLKLSFTHK